MSTKVFISWSGDLSKQLAEAIRNWIPSVLQFVKPYFTPDDIEKGAKWGSDISRELESSDIGLLCLTPDNTEKPWILFEAGALSKNFNASHVCTVLFNLEPTDLKGPLTSFQTTRFQQDEMKKLILTINNSAGDSKLDASVLNNVFEMWWPKLDENVKKILASAQNGTIDERRSDRDILEELLQLSRMKSSNVVHRSQHSRQAIVELVDNLSELQMMFRHSEGKLVYSIYKRLQSPIQRLCIESNIPDVYERFMITQRDFTSDKDREIQNNSLTNSNSALMLLKLLGNEK